MATTEHLVDVTERLTRRWDERGLTQQRMRMP